MLLLYNSLKTQWLKYNGLSYSYTSQKSEIACPGLRPRHSRGCIPSGGHRGEPLPFQFLEASRVPWPWASFIFKASNRIPLTSDCVITSPSVTLILLLPSYENTGPPTWVIQDNLPKSRYLISSHLQSLSCHIRKHSRVLWIKRRTSVRVHYSAK